jgi:DNA-binding beta-propeller fold protein YncE
LRNASPQDLQAGNINVTNLIIGGNTVDRMSLHPEFTFDGKFVYVSVWEQNGSVAVIDAYTLEIVKYITGLTTPTGIFNVGLRAEEYGL